MGFLDFIKKQLPSPTTIMNHVKSDVELSYYRELEKIEVMWSVVSNLRAYNGTQAVELEHACLQNISRYPVLRDQYMRQGVSVPLHAPGYVRLCMLYEKQGRYNDAAQICKSAIDDGAIEDGTKGKMYGRLARLMRKGQTAPQ